jgi:hypothetical protein
MLTDDGERQRFVLGSDDARVLHRLALDGRVNSRYP